VNDDDDDETEDFKATEREIADLLKACVCDLPVGTAIESVVEALADDLEELISVAVKALKKDDDD